MTAVPLRVEISCPAFTILATPSFCSDVAEQRGKDEKTGDGQATPKA